MWTVSEEGWMPLSGIKCQRNIMKLHFLFLSWSVLSVFPYSCVIIFPPYSAAVLYSGADASRCYRWREQRCVLSPTAPHGKRMRSRCERSQGKKKDCYVCLGPSSWVKTVSNEQKPKILILIFLNC